MRGFMFTLIFLALCNFNTFKESEYNDPVSRYDLEVRKSEKDSTGQWRIYKNNRLGPVYLQLTSTEQEKQEDMVAFYIFDNEDDAKEAFQKMPETMYSLSVNEEDRIVGFDGGVCDAEIESLRFLDGNVIIYAELGVYGAWGDISQEYAHPVRDDALMEYVLANHEYLRNYANQKIQWIIDCKQK